MPLSPCRHGVAAVFFKQWGGVRKSKAGRELDGKKYDGFPSRVALPVLEKPNRLAAIAEIEVLFQPANAMPEPSLLPQQAASR